MSRLFAPPPAMGRLTLLAVLALALLSLMLPLDAYAAPAALAGAGAADASGGIVGRAATWTGWKLVGLATPVVVAVLTVPTVQLLKALFRAVDTAPAWLKQSLAAGVAAALTAIGTAVGAPLPLTGGDVSAGGISAFLAALLALVLHAARKTTAQGAADARRR